MAAVVEAEKVVATAVPLTEIDVGVSPAPVAVDAVAFHNLASVTQVELKQGNVFWEFVSGGCAANTYAVKDRASGLPIFLIQERSSCCMRCCCNGCQPLYVKFHNAEGPYRVPAQQCCGFTLVPEHDRYKPAGEAVMTLERPGFPDKCCIGHCWVCFNKCQAETWTHSGNVGLDDGSDVNKIGREASFAHSIVPIGGGGFTPSVHVMERDVTGNETPFAKVEGPTCFGGCMDLFIDTHFFVSRMTSPKKAGDVAMIRKKANDDGGMGGFCKALCTNVDTYEMDFIDPSLTPQQKAAIISEGINLDYLFFDQEQPVCRYNEQNKTCEILLCLCYCYGCLCPCKCIIPTKSEG